MKKILAVAILMVMMVLGVFADTVVAPVSTVGQLSGKEASIEVTLGVVPSDMYFYTFGFSNNPGSVELPVNGKTSVPGSAEATLALDYDPETSTATNKVTPLYLYYKARTNQNFALNIETVGDLEDKNSKAADLGWTVEFEKVTVEGANVPEFSNTSIYSGGTTLSKISITPEGDSDETYASYKLTITTDTIPLLDQEASYTGTLKLSVAAN